MPSERPTSVVDQFLSRAALRGEKVVASVRLLLCALFLGQYLLLSQAVGRSMVSFSFWINVSAFVLGILYSARVLRGRQAGPSLRNHLYASVVIDALIITASLTSYAIYAPSNYSGFLRETNTAIIILACVSPGVRLVRSAALLGAALMVLLTAGLVVVDHTLNAALLQYGAADMLNFAIFLSGAGLLGYTVAARTRRLVHEGADAAVAAELARQRLGIYVS